MCTDRTKRKKLIIQQALMKLVLTGQMPGRNSSLKTDVSQMPQTQEEQRAHIVLKRWALFWNLLGIILMLVEHPRSKFGYIENFPSRSLWKSRNFNSLTCGGVKEIAGEEGMRLKTQADKTHSVHATHTHFNGSSSKWGQQFNICALQYESLKCAGGLC